MKNRLYILLFAVLLGSCDNFVDIVPKGQNIPTTVDDLAKILNEKNNIGGGGKNWYFMSDDVYFSSSDLTNQGTSTCNAYTWAPYMYTALEKDADWATAYYEIYFANYVIEHILTAPESPSRIYNRQETYGRALLIRACNYWYLVSAYAPLYDEATAGETLAVPMPVVSDVNARYPRSTVAEVYKQIFEDINTALALEELPDWRTYNIWPCKAAAYALLSRIYLQQGKWAEAEENARKALDIKDVLTDYNTMKMNDPTNAAEGVEGFEKNDTQDPEVILCRTAGTNMTSGYVSQALLDSYDKTKDLRYRYLFSDKDKSGNQLQGFVRANYQSTSNSIRIAEVYLNRAEALARLGGTANLEAARGLLDVLRANRYENPDELDAGMTQEELLEEVLLERRRELRFTCFRWFDMKRLKVTVTREGLNGEPATITGDSPRYTWAIPLDIMNFNPQLVQNER